MKEFQRTWVWEELDHNTKVFIHERFNQLRYMQGSSQVFGVGGEQISFPIYKHIAVDCHPGEGVYRV